MIASDRAAFTKGSSDAFRQGLDAGLGEALRIFDRDILGATIAVMDETAAVRRPSVMKSLLQSVQDEVGVGRSASSPADNTAGVSVDDEGDKDEAGPGRHR